MGIIGQALNERSGYWGTPTSTVDWCEENYVVCKYISEFWNTISNVFTVFIPIIAYYLDWHSPLHFAYRLQYTALACVGIGSWCFHGTLLYHLQLLDELPMIYGSCIMFYCTSMVDAPPQSSNPVLMMVLIAYSAFTTFVYLVLQNPTFFFFCYGFLVLCITIKTILLQRQFKQMSHQLFYISLAIYASGFAMWLVDFHYCHILRSIRSRIDYPFSELFQLHAWWHVFSFYGTYLYILYTMRLRLASLGLQSHLACFAGVVPYVKCRYENYRPKKQR